MDAHSGRPIYAGTRTFAAGANPVPFFGLRRILTPTARPAPSHEIPPDAGPRHANSSPPTAPLASPPGPGVGLPLLGHDLPRHPRGRQDAAAGAVRRPAHRGRRRRPAGL